MIPINKGDQTTMAFEAKSGESTPTKLLSVCVSLLLFCLFFAYLSHMVLVSKADVLFLQDEKFDFDVSLSPAR